MITEFETTDQMEMAFLYFKGFPYTLDKTNPYKVKMIAKGDPILIKGLIEDLWADRNDFRRHINAFKAIKQSLWIGGIYKKDFYKSFDSAKPNENQNEIEVA